MELDSPIASIATIANLLLNNPQIGNFDISDTQNSNCINMLVQANVLNSTDKESLIEVSKKNLSRAKILNLREITPLDIAIIR